MCHGFRQIDERQLSSNEVDALREPSRYCMKITGFMGILDVRLSTSPLRASPPCSMISIGQIEQGKQRISPTSICIRPWAGIQHLS